MCAAPLMAGPEKSDEFCPAVVEFRRQNYFLSAGFARGVGVDRKREARPHLYYHAER
jgi:hypothetical protein